MRTRTIVIGVVVVLAILAGIGLIVAWVVGRHAIGVMPGLLGGWRYGVPRVHGLGPMMFLGPAAWLVGLIALGGLLWLAFSGRRPRTGADELAAGPEKPLDIVKRRYAAGEITREQYEQMRQDLE